MMFLNINEWVSWICGYYYQFTLVRSLNLSGKSMGFYFRLRLIKVGKFFTDVLKIFEFLFHFNEKNIIEYNCGKKEKVNFMSHFVEIRSKVLIKKPFEGSYINRAALGNYLVLPECDENTEPNYLVFEDRTVWHFKNYLEIFEKTEISFIIHVYFDKWQRVKETHLLKCLIASELFISVV